MFSWPALAALALLSYLGTLPYRQIWTRIKGDGLTPKGYGALLPFFVTAYASVASASPDLVWAGAAISLMTAIYWIDDIGHLRVTLRLALQFGSGAAMAWLALRNGSGDLPLPLPLACLLAGAANVGLTNMINFYDGADLHISMLLVLLAAALIVIPAANADYVPVGLAILAFVLPFAFVNPPPNSLYFGDAGAFAVASLAALLAVTATRDGDGQAALAAMPLMLPAIDVAYVFVLRVSRGEDMLSRNYHHLYQQLQIRYRGFWYLLPQPVFAAILLAAAFGLINTGFHPLMAVAASSLVLTPILYFVSRAIFLR